MRTLDEYRVGEVERFGSYRMTREEVIDFASRFDPQSFHLDDLAAAANPIFGRLSASGWHTAAATMRMLVDHSRRFDGHALASPGVEELRWEAPAYPGDTLSVETEILDTRPSRSRPEIGLVRTRISTFNQYGELVMSMVATTVVPAAKA
jgi:acyl dehydratase